MRGVRHVGVHAEFDEVPGRIELTPYKNEGARGGFTATDDAVRPAAYESPAQLGQAVLAALEEATA